ncbi:MAG: ribonuclease P protein component [Chloroflexi bacterium]|nr:ribonuclease P protein component [Chloroflexota bacterium]MDA8189089.1 ribonuclease P protein component [Dehalococcoidales bacterium]
MQKQYRLRKEVEFKQVRGKGRSWAHPLIVLYALPNSLSVTRVGFSVSKRIGKAVRRNRARRLIREAVRLRHSDVKQGWDLLFIARKPIVDADFEQVRAAVDHLLRRAGLLQPTGAGKGQGSGLAQGLVRDVSGTLSNAGSDLDEDSGA